MARSARSAIQAELLFPGGSEYESARRVWNGMHDRTPAFIARCRTASEVSSVVRHAVRENLPLTVRGGGHNVAGTAVADGAVMIDLSPMRDVTVDSEARVAVAQGGCLLRDLDAATTSHGLACPAGVVSHTGLGGLVLGGGYGWLARRYGLTCDHLLAAEVVLADGSVAEVGEGRYEDLLWALRGGGGNFGVVTSFTLRLRPVEVVHRHVGVYPLSEAASALAGYGEFAECQPLDMHATGALKFAASDEWIPSELRSRPALFLTAAWFGSPGSGASANARLFNHVRPAAALVQALSYAELQRLGDHSEPHGNRYFTKSCYLTGLGDTTIAGMIAAARDMRSPASSIDFEYLRGAISAVPETGSAFPARDAPYMYTASAQWTDPGADGENAAWSRQSIDRLREAHHGGAYVNYVQDEFQGGTAELYGNDRYRRLADVKRRYDPLNMFHHNQNISPAAND
ncbi:FAD-binding oxidoreductase [Amycolatopsis sp. PS_44_ISF1]|nr:FAD-binding oxidoreductase [Amycolatopsis sp. PS_44_ISF1]MDT8916004.1 FAD-binding oxidoreductase [Amycolatopsis sp. PS_44_ISF1]